MNKNKFIPKCMARVLLVSSLVGITSLGAFSVGGDEAQASQSSKTSYKTTKYVNVGNSYLNIRSSYSVNSKRLTTAKTNAKVKTIYKIKRNSSTWVYGTVNGKKGWMNAKYLSSKKKTTKKASSKKSIKKVSNSNSNLISYGAQFRGVPYVWGGTTPNGFDCSGFTSYVYKNAKGKSIPRTSGAQYAASKKISKSELKAGDLVFFSVGSSRITHVALYAGNGQLLHAAGSSVHYQSLYTYWDRYVVGYGRF